MNPLSCVKTTLKEMKPLLATHPENAWLKKWVKRHTGTLAEVKKGGYTPEFERFWTAYPRTRGTSKSDAYGAWCKVIDEPEAAIEAARLYAKDMKGTEPSKVAHPTTWLNGKRHESYEGVKEKVLAAQTCKICKEQPFYRNIMVKVGNAYASVGVCRTCQRYDGMTKEEINRKRSQ